MKILNKGITIFSPLALAISLIFFFLSSYLVSLELAGIGKLEITAQAESTDYWQVFVDPGGGEPDFTARSSSALKELKSGEIQTLIFSLGNTPVTWIRVDPGTKPGTVRIFQLVIKRRFIGDSIYTAEDLYTMLIPEHPGMSIALGDGFVEAMSTQSDPALRFRALHFKQQYYHLFILPVVLLSFYLYHFLIDFDPGKVWEWLLVDRILPSDNRSVIESLDGLRAIAAVMVVADHTWPKFRGVGAGGVLIFFVLSGFLLARPFVKNPEIIRQRGFFLNYGKKRLRRILPMYYFYIVLVYVLSLDIGDAILHAFFLEGEGHLWAIPQEMLYYLVFPGIVIGAMFLSKNRPAQALSILLLLAIGSDFFFDRSLFFLYGMDHQYLPFYLGVFLSGTCASFLYYGWYEDRGFTLFAGKRWFVQLCTLTSCAVIGIFIFFSNGTLIGNTRMFAQQFHGIYGGAAALLLFSLVAVENSPLVRFLSRPSLKSLGVVSYSLYLLHPLVINIILEVDRHFFCVDLPGCFLFVVTLALGIPLSVFTYRVIESPFLLPVGHELRQK